MNICLIVPNVFLALFVQAGCSVYAAPIEITRPVISEVIVLSALHQYHPRLPSYGYLELSTIIERLIPKVLAVELSAEDIASRRAQRVKQEYPQAIFPLLDRSDYVVVPLEPSDPVRSELIKRLVEAEKSFAAESPERSEALDAYEELVWFVLLDRWRSPCDVNSSQTDQLFSAKHHLQDLLEPPDQAYAWNAWNENFLKQILIAVNKNPGERVVVIVGAEHSFWLRGRLANETSIKLLDTSAALRSMGSCSAH